MPRIIFIKPTGKGSPSIYSHELAKRLNQDPDIEIKKVSTPLTSYSEFCNFLKYLIDNKKTTIHFPFQYYAKFGLLTKKSIVTVHDMWWVDYPYRDIYPNIRDWIYTKLDTMGIKGAIHIITSSNYSKKQIVNYLQIDPLKISVIYLGVDHDIFRPVKNIVPFDFDYILYVGSEQPRKNIKTLLEAFKKLKQNPEFGKLKLVKVGGPETENFRLQTIKEINNLNLKEDVIFTGYINEEHLPVIYSNARCFVSPSLCEGFGLPTLEAMACGCPVITSNTSAFPEIVSTAGLMRDPFDVAGYSKDMEIMITDNKLRDDYIRKGIERARMFSWDITVEKIINVYKNCAIEKDLFS